MACTLSLRVLFVAWLAMLFSTGCKPQVQDASDLNAIVSADGKYAFGLVPMRNFAPPLGDDYSFEVGRRIANALRTVYGTVECRGNNAAMQMNILEGMAAQNPEAVRRERERLILMNEVGSLRFDGCKVIGSYNLSVGSFVAIFSSAPKDQTAFELQQTVWLAARGPSVNSTATFSAGFYDFLYEGLGAFPTKDQDTFAAALAKLDQLYNPCVRGKSSFDKDRSFGCDANKNYVVKSTNYQSTRNKLLALTASIEKSMLARIKELDTGGDIDGFETAIRVSASIADLEIKAQAERGSDKPVAPPKKTPEKISPIIRALGSKLASIEKVFAIRIGAQPGEVYSISNPLATNQPPLTSRAGFGLQDTTGTTASTTSTASTASTATASPGEWTSNGSNGFQRPLGNGQYETSVAHKNANGGWDYTNSTWSSGTSGGWERQNTYAHGNRPQTNYATGNTGGTNTFGGPNPSQYDSPNMTSYETKNTANLGKDPYTWQRMGNDTFQRQLENGRWETAKAYQENNSWQYNKATWESADGDWQKMNFDNATIGQAVESNPFGGDNDPYNKANNQCADMARNSGQYMERYYGGETKMVHYTQPKAGEDQVNHAMTAWRPNGSKDWVLFDAQTQKWENVGTNLTGQQAQSAITDISTQGYSGQGEATILGTKGTRSTYGRASGGTQTGWDSPIRQETLGGFWLNWTK